MGFKRPSLSSPLSLENSTCGLESQLSGEGHCCVGMGSRAGIPAPRKQVSDPEKMSEMPAA